MPMAEYPVPEDGEWVQPSRVRYLMQCCDCGLVHRLRFRLVKYAPNKRKIQFQVFRENGETKRARKLRGIVVK